MLSLKQEDVLASAVATAVLEGLTAYPKHLPPWLLYDAEGSALFEEITELPEYYLTRVERGILENNAADIVERVGGEISVIELGAGTASKTGILIRAILRRQPGAVFYPIDVSASALETAVHRLNGSFPALSVRPVVADYSSGLAQLAATPGRKLVLYIGSSIGNYEPEDASALLRNIRQSMGPRDALLLGTDLVKDPSVLLPAYDDAAGVTVRFNKNLLARINRELGARFDLRGFRHIAEWNQKNSRMEIYLESTRAQAALIEALGITVSFRAGERIHTENSYKYPRGMVEGILKTGGFHIENTWHDAKQWFAVHLARVNS